MKYITCSTPGTHGRNGHHLKDIFTSYMFSFLIDNLTVLPKKSWNTEQSILNFPSLDINPSTNIEVFSEILEIELPYDRDGPSGMTFSNFQEIKNKIETAPEECLIDIIQRAAQPRIHPVQLTEWFNQELITEDAFINKFIPTVRKLYYTNKQPESLDCLSIHIRRGDIANPASECYKDHKFMFWPVEYFDNQIINFKTKHPNLPIYIFSENGMGHEDLLILERHNNLNLCLGDTRTLKADINTMVNSKFFMPSNSSLSTWISYISTGEIIMPQGKNIKHFHEKFIW